MNAPSAEPRGPGRGDRGVYNPEELSLGRAARLGLRAIALRCPHCGGGGLLASWFRLRPRCPTCGIRTERGEEDFFLGSMMFNIVLSGGVFAVVLVATLLLTWPSVPWTLLTWGTPLLMVVAPFLVFPWTKTLWLASDILMRPVTGEEMDWYARNEENSYRSFRDR